MYLDLHTVMNMDSNKSDGERNRFFSSPTDLLIFSVLVLYINFVFNKISILCQLQNGYLGKTHDI